MPGSMSAGNVVTAWGGSPTIPPKPGPGYVWNGTAWVPPAQAGPGAVTQPVQAPAPVAPPTQPTVSPGVTPPAKTVVVKPRNPGRPVTPVVTAPVAPVAPAAPAPKPAQGPLMPSAGPKPTTFDTKLPPTPVMTQPVLKPVQTTQPSVTASTDPNRLRFTGGSQTFNEQQPTIPTKGQEVPLAAQRPDNPVSNALALARDVNQEFAMPDFTGVANDQINAGNALIDRTLQQGLADQDNRYMGGPGVTGARIRQRQQTMEDAGLQKANFAQGVRGHYTDLAANLNEARRNSTLGAGLDQNRLQVGTVQQERDRAQNEQDLITRLRHEAGIMEAQQNRADKRDLLTAAMPILMGDKPKTASEQLAEQMPYLLAQQMGLPYQQPVQQQPNPGIIPGLLGDFGLGDLGAILQQFGLAI